MNYTFNYMIKDKINYRI